MSLKVPNQKTRKTGQQIVENTKEQGQVGNIRQNIINQGRQQDR